MIKRLISAFILLLCFAGLVSANLVPEMREPNTVWHLEQTNKMLVTQRLTLTADDSNVALSNVLNGGLLYSVEIYSTDDDAMTFTLNSHLGTQLFTTTTTAATSGDGGPKAPSVFWPAVTGTMKYTLADFSGVGSVTIEVTVIKR